MSIVQVLKTTQATPGAAWMLSGEQIDHIQKLSNFFFHLD